MLMSVDLTNKSFCNGLSLTDFMDFNMKGNIKQLESELCKTDFDKLLMETSRDPVFQNYIKKVIVSFTVMVSHTDIAHVGFNIQV